MLKNDSHISEMLIWSTASLIVILVAALSYYFVHTAKKHVIFKASMETSISSYLVSEWVSQSFEIPRFLLKRVVSKIPPEDLIYPPKSAELHAEQTEFITQHEKLGEKVLFLGLFDSDCMATHSSVPAVKLGTSIKEREYCALARQEPLDEFKTSNMFVSVTNKMNITFSYPVLDEHQSMRGFALIALDLSFFQTWLDQLNSSDINHNAVISILDYNQKLLGRVPFAEQSLGKLVNDSVLREFIQSPQLKKSQRIVSPVDGIDRIWAFRKIEKMPFVIVTGLPIDELLYSWYQQVIITLLSNIVFAFFAFFAALKLIQNKRMAKEMEKLAVTDKLTSIYNRFKLDELLKNEMARFERFNHAFGLILLDVDHFKSVNDTFGHQTGDAVLIDIAHILRTNCRQTDYVGRWGGEEFLIACPGTDEKRVIILAEKLRTVIKKHDFPIPNDVTASFGVTISAQSESVEEVIKRVDQALYQAKEEGRNRVVFANPLKRAPAQPLHEWELHEIRHELHEEINKNTIEEINSEALKEFGGHLT